MHHALRFSLAAFVLAFTTASRAHEPPAASPGPALAVKVLDIGSRKQLFIDERFIAEKQGVQLVVNPPMRAGAINVAAQTAPCVVEHNGVCHLYQGLNGRTSLWTSTDGDLDCGLQMMGIGMLRRGDEIPQYYDESRRTHEEKERAEKEGRRGEAIFRTVQRLDGFVSADAGSRGGEFTTSPIIFSGNRLVLNAACHGLGEIWVEIRDEAGQPVRHRFVMRSAKLTAFHFITSPTDQQLRGE